MPDKNGFPLPNTLSLLQQVRNFSGAPNDFWNLYLKTLRNICNALSGVVCIQDAQGQWRTLTYSPTTGNYQKFIQIFLEHIDSMSLMCSKKGYGVIQDETFTLISVPLMIDSQQGKCIALFYLPKSSDDQVLAFVNSLLFSSDLFAQYRFRQSMNESLNKSKYLTSILELGLSLGGCTKFLQAAITLVNDLATQLNCDRVSLGVLIKGYLRIKSISHTDTFEKKMDVVRSLEVTMEEALDQDADLVFPLPENSNLIIRAHESYAKSQDSSYLSSILLRHEGEVFACILLERSSKPFNEGDQKRLRVTADQVAPRLFDLLEKDKNIFSLGVSKSRKLLAKILGFEHTWWKLGGILALLLSVFMFLIPIPYRIDATFILKTDELLYITAPFDGYIDSVFVVPGDEVNYEQKLLRLDDQELQLKEAELTAQLHRYRREAQKARAEGRLAEISIAQAQTRQTIAKLETVRFQLNQSVLRSAIHGKSVIVEGDLQDKKGSPVRAGEELFRIAKIENIYAEIEVEEIEIENLNEGVKGEISLRSRPEIGFPVQITRVNPASTVKDQKNVFLARAELSNQVPTWFRPGMTGVAKINAGNRTFWWIISHRAIDFLRLKLWW